jgi:hypothetical protein
MCLKGRAFCMETNGRSETRETAVKKKMIGFARVVGCVRVNARLSPQSLLKTHCSLSVLYEKQI